MPDPHAPIDPAEFRNTQREAWSSVAAGWSRWWEVFEVGAGHLNRLLVERSGARPGDRVLDLATGIGEPALTAAHVVGPTGSVLACDLSPRMLEFAAERARRAGLSNLEFAESDAQDLELEPESFDAAVTRWGLMLMLEPSRALDRVRQALRPGARLAASVWAAPETAPFLATPMRVARRVLDLEPHPPDAPGPFRLAAEGALDELFTRAGFREVDHEPATVHMSFESARGYREFLGDLSSSFRKTLADRTDEERDRVWAEIERETLPWTDAAGRLVFDNQAWCVWGRRV
jgi:ubiquinone/menaquinone biosynthesis C-methylase UbiE